MKPEARTGALATFVHCVSQVLTHKVAVAPAPGLTAREAELRFPNGAHYSTYLEFVGAGHFQQVRDRLGYYDSNGAVGLG